MITHKERLEYTGALLAECIVRSPTEYSTYKEWLAHFNAMVDDFLHPSKEGSDLGDYSQEAAAKDLISHCMQLVAMVENNPNVCFAIADGCLNIMRTKGLSYANEQDCLANFKNAAKEAGTTPEQAMIIYIIKPIQSIRNVIIRNPDNPTVADGEAIRGRVMDIINYIVLMLLRAKERAAARDEKQEGNEHELATN